MSEVSQIIDKTLLRGVELQLAGETKLAKQLYSAILKISPRHADANHNLGAVEMDLGEFLEAKYHFAVALEENRAKPEYWVSYIDNLIVLSDIDDPKHMDDATHMLEQARSLGANGEVFDRLEKTLESFYEQNTTKLN